MPKRNLKKVNKGRALYCPIHQMTFEQVREFYSELLKLPVKRVTPYWGGLTDSVQTFGAGAITKDIRLKGSNNMFAGDIDFSFSVGCSGVTANIGSVSLSLITVSNELLSTYSQMIHEHSLNQGGTYSLTAVGKKRVFGNNFNYNQTGPGSGSLDTRYSFILSGVLLSFERLTRLSGAEDYLLEQLI